MTKKFDPERLVFPAAEVEYDREKALAFWQQVEPDDIISSLASEMLSTISHVRLDINTMLAEPRKDQIALSNDKVTLSQIVHSLWNSYTALKEMLDIIYLYESNRKKQKMFGSEDESLNKEKMRYPDKVRPEFMNQVPIWFEEEPLKFLSTIIPLTELETSQLGALIQELNDKKELNVIMLFEGKFTLERVAKEIQRQYWILSEEFFLLASYTKAHSHEK
jgi:hypothetical protein